MVLKNALYDPFRIGVILRTFPVTYGTKHSLGRDMPTHVVLNLSILRFAEVR